MKKPFIGAILFMIASCQLQAQTKLNPVIKHYGELFDVPFAVVKPDPSIDYKIVAEMGRAASDSSEVDEGLDAVARMYNLHVYGGVPRNQIHITLVLFAGATRLVLNNEAYRKRFGIDNPNIEIIEEMKQAGISLIVCAQSVMNGKVDPATVNPNVDIATSRFTAVSTLQMQGYGFFKL